MKTHRLLISLIFLFSAEIAALLIFAAQTPDMSQDAIAVNEAIQSVQEHWADLKSASMDETNRQPGSEIVLENDAGYRNPTELDFVVLNLEEEVLFRTRSGLSESIHAAVIHRDAILDIESNGSIMGKILIYNNDAQILQTRKQAVIFFLSAVLCIQCGIMIWYFFYLNRAVIRPFRKLKGFAERVAGGNLDVPLEMDRGNLFGAFTESFDIMRSELKKARIAEAEANAAKKELVAKLSHDIKTPVASIKAASEVGAALTEKAASELAPNPLPAQLLENYTQIIRKADQINSLITNLFTATLEELRQLTVTPSDMPSRELREIFESADYLHRAAIPHIPDCLLYADRLRLQQVFDNLFANSYKYAGTKIVLSVSRKERCLSVSMADYGGGVPAEELPLLMEKFKRGSNSSNTEGAGLGLYISDYFMKEMHGELFLENGQNGLKVTVRIAFSGFF
nr:HAMP domain-containing sensor histidine kinase [uncultured Schaedlerella sp.]